MPVQFICPACRRTLSVGRKKIGCQVTCPKCGASITVLAGELAPASAVVAPPITSDFRGIAPAPAFDDVPGFVSHPPVATEPDDSQGMPVVVPLGRREPGLPRNAILLQAVLGFLIAIVAFGLGYLLGGSDANRRAATKAAAEKAAVEKAAVENVETTTAPAESAAPAAE